MLNKRQASIRDRSLLSPARAALPVFALVLAIGLAACSSTSESGREGGEGREGGGEESATRYALADTYWMTRAGARLVLRYDPATQTFRGTVTNVTGATLPSVRVEVHLSNGVELGPTTPMDLAPGQTVDVELPAPGEVFATWGAHPEVGSEGEGTGMAAFTPGLGSWAAVDGVDLGIEHPGHRMSAWYTSQGGAWTAHLSPDPAPQHQPTGSATWTGEWAGYHGADPSIGTGAARVTVTLGAATDATLALEDVPTLGTLEWDAMRVNDGRFSGRTTANSEQYEATGQFGGPDQAGVVGHASGSGFRSVFYGEKE